jgi:TRAP-type C4-dicarboxylate transport system permease small subunit
MGETQINVEAKLGITGFPRKMFSVKGIWAGSLRLCGGIGTLALFLLMVVTTIDVFSRYVFNYPVPGVFEVDAYLLWTVIFGLPLVLVQRDKRHISVTLLTERFPPGLRKVLEIVSAITLSGLLALLSWRAGVAVYMDWLEHSLIEGVVVMPMWWTRLLIFIGFALFLIQSCIDLGRAIRRKP